MPAVIQSHYAALFSLHSDEISEFIMEIDLVQLISLKIPASTHGEKIKNIAKAKKIINKKL